MVYKLFPEDFLGDPTDEHLISVRSCIFSYLYPTRSVLGTGDHISVTSLWSLQGLEYIAAS